MAQKDLINFLLDHQSRSEIENIVEEIGEPLESPTESFVASASSPIPFLKFPAEIRNQVYRYLLSPEENTTHGFHYGYQLCSVLRTRIHTNILLTNRQIYGEAHPILYSQSGPSLLVRKVPVTHALDHLTGIVGFEPLYVPSQSPSIVKGTTAQLQIDYRWEFWSPNRGVAIDEVGPEATDYHKRYRGHGQPVDIVVVGTSAIDRLIRWLQLLQYSCYGSLGGWTGFGITGGALTFSYIEEPGEDRGMTLNFEFNDVPTNVRGDVVLCEELRDSLQVKLLRRFERFYHPVVDYTVSGFKDQEYLDIFLKQIKQPITWLRYETLQLMDLLSKILKDSNRIPSFRDHLADCNLFKFICILLDTRILQSDQLEKWGTPSPYDTEPLNSLYRCYVINIYNLMVSVLRLMFKRWPSYHLSIPHKDCKEFKILMKASIESIHELDEGFRLDELLTTKERCEFLWLESIYIIYDELSYRPEQNTYSWDSFDLIGLRKLQECMQRSISYLPADDARAEKVAEINEVILGMGPNSRTDAENRELHTMVEKVLAGLISLLPAENMTAIVPAVNRSHRIDYERKVLKEWGYTGDLLESRFVQRIGEGEWEDEGNGNLVGNTKPLAGISKYEEDPRKTSWLCVDPTFGRDFVF